jgi:hypothetical protein
MQDAPRERQRGGGFRLHLVHRPLLRNAKSLPGARIRNDGSEITVVKIRRAGGTTVSTPIAIAIAIAWLSAPGSAMLPA